MARTRQQLVEEGFEAVLIREHSPASARPRIPQYRKMGPPASKTTATPAERGVIGNAEIELHQAKHTAGECLGLAQGKVIFGGLPGNVLLAYSVDGR